MSETWNRVLAARDPKRPTAQYYIDAIFHDFFELHGDRLFADDPAIVAGLAWLDSIPVTVIGQEKGTTPQEKTLRRFGSPNPDGYRKALRLMEQAEKFNRPVICLVDTQGAYPGIGAEERGQGRAIADNLMKMMVLKVPTISVILGEGGSGGALALAVSDRVAVLENAIYSILSPEGFASILWRDSSRAQEAAGVMKLTAGELKELGVVDEVIPEPQGDAKQDPEAAAQAVKNYIVRELKKLMKLSADELVEKRQAKFRAMGRS